MIVLQTALPDVVSIRPERHVDERGYVAEAFRASALEAIVGPLHFVQSNHAMSRRRGTIRGLHYQAPPAAQGKLVRCVAGAILDIAVDLRAGSASFGRHVAVELSAENGHLLWIPPGFAHGFCTLSPDAVVLYDLTAYYSPAHDRGLLWNDPALGIPWPVGPDEAVVSAKDRNQPCLADIATPFLEGWWPPTRGRYDGGRPGLEGGGGERA